MNDLLQMFATKVVSVSFEHEGQKVEILVKQLSARKVFALQAMQKEKGNDNESFALFLLTETVCDPEGKPNLKKEDAQKLLDSQMLFFNTLVGEVAKAAGLTSAKPAEVKPGNA